MFDLTNCKAGTLLVSRHGGVYEYLDNQGENPRWPHRLKHDSYIFHYAGDGVFWPGSNSYTKFDIMGLADNGSNI